MESFHTLLKKEHVYQRPTYQTFEEARRKNLSYVQGFYKNRRIHSALTFLSAVEFEKKILAAKHKKSLVKSVLIIDSNPI
ncbi:IS3 family transposase [Enterococcus gilvus]|uniref:IS3 family transposase n=1 Tax=Enterococcus gilvus TaxID=160453 RepID=UPI003D6B08A3